MFAVLAATSAASQPAPASLFPLGVLWTVPFDRSMPAPAAFHDARAYVPLDDGRVEAYDLADGARVWAAPATAVFRPATGEGLVYVAESQSLSAWHDADGRLAWRQDLPEPLGVAPAWDHGWLITITASGTVSALRGADGQMLWQRHLDAPPAAVPTLEGDRVYVVTGDDHVVALAVQTGTLLWTRRLGGTPQEVLALPDRVYVGTTDNFLYCLSTSDGGIDWRWRTGGDVIGRPVADDRRVYFVSLDNVLRALNRRTGNQQWLRPLPLRPSAGPVRAGDALLVSGVSPLLRAYTLADGRAAGEGEAPGELTAPPYVVDGDVPVIVVVTRDVARGAVLSALGARGADAPAP